jgi:hypothetical protein
VKRPSCCPTLVVIEIVNYRPFRSQQDQTPSSEPRTYTGVRGDHKMASSIVSPLRNTYRYLVCPSLAFPFAPRTVLTNLLFLIGSTCARLQTATPGARVARPLLLCSARARRPRARIRRSSNPRTHGLPPTRAHTNYIPKCVFHRPISYSFS